MKRIISLLLTLLLTLGLFACGTEPDPTTVPPTEPPVTTVPETTVPETTAPETTAPPIETQPPETVPPETEPLGAYFEGMDELQLQYWFYDFDWEYRLDYMPHFPLSVGPSTDSGEYLFWAYAINYDNWGEERGKMPRQHVDEAVNSYFGITPVDHRTHDYAWTYDEDTELYIIYPAGSLKDRTHSILHSIEQVDGIYTVHATRYHWIHGYPTEEDNARLKAALFNSDFTELVEFAEITVSFRLDEETGKPIFCGYVEESLLS